MSQRNKIEYYLSSLETELRGLEILYEQYFSGVEKREPCRQRESVAKKIRTLSNRRIIQTDLRFKFQSLASRYHSYSAYWDRILRLMDEGKYVRKDTAGTSSPRQKSPPPESEIDRLYRDLVTAHRENGNSKNLPGRDKFASMIDQQRDKMQRKLNGREIEFRVVTENGKPKIKVRARK